MSPRRKKTDTSKASKCIRKNHEKIQAKLIKRGERRLEIQALNATTILSEVRFKWPNGIARRELSDEERVFRSGIRATALKFKIPLPWPFVLGIRF